MQMGIETPMDIEPLTPRVRQDPYTVDIKTLKWAEKLGQGSFGSVYRAINPVDGAVYAVKFVNTNGRMDKALAELKIAITLRHPNIVRYYNFIQEDITFENRTYDLAILMEYIKGQDMSDLIEVKDARIRTQYGVEYTYQLISALDYMQTKCISHQDIKPANIMVAGDRAVLVDFGLSCKGCSKSDVRCGECTDDIKCKSTSISGTLAYFSPAKASAMLNGTPDKFNRYKDDVWAVGISLLEIYTGVHNPFCRDTKSKQECLAVVSSFKGYDDNFTQYNIPLIPSMIILDIVTGVEEERPFASELNSRLLA
jgi:serine/threonine/tyrosine protein kinase RAD53